MDKMKVLSSWSGGKDSCYALLCAIKEGDTPAVLLNVMNESGKISRSHGLPEYLLAQQANAMQVPLVTISSSWAEYEKNFVNPLKEIKSTYNVHGAVFGDIDLQPHRDWEEKVCAAAQLTPLLPLWQRPRKPLVLEMLATDIECMIVSCNLLMGEKFLGRILDAALVEELEQLGIDACGENGEFHTLVTHCPLFNSRIVTPPFTTTTHNDYCFLQWHS